MKIEPILKIGDSYNDTIATSYDHIVEVLGFKSNVTRLVL